MTDRPIYTDDRSGISFPTDHPFGAQLAQSLETDRANTQRWIAELRERGVRAAHPDDGWVYRSTETTGVIKGFVYPDFFDGVIVGDRVALGWHDRYRVVEIIDIEVWGPICPSPRFAFVEIERFPKPARPPAKPRRSGWFSWLKGDR